MTHLATSLLSSRFSGVYPHHASSLPIQVFLQTSKNEVSLD